MTRAEAIEKALRSNLAIVEWFQRFAITQQHNVTSKVVSGMPYDRAGRYLECAVQYDKAAKQCQDAIDAAESALSLPADDGWLPMDSAPKDGTEVLVVSKSGYRETARFEDGDWCDRNYRIVLPVGWRPLPAAPEAAL